MGEWTGFLLIFLIMGWGFFILILVVSNGYPNDIELLMQQIPCEKLIELDIHLDTWNARDWVKEECF